MAHLPLFLSDLALILCTAGVISLLFKFLRQPVVLGYILAGLLVGPNFDLFPTVLATEGVKIWAEIGVIFLLFGLGLEFSFKRMLKIGKIVGFTAITGVAFTLFTGYLVGKSMGWKEMDCLFFGGILAIASTTIIIRSFEELGVKTKNFAGLVIGILVIEDLVAVILMVLLSTVSVSQSFEGTEMVYSILKLVFFLVLWFVSGIYFLPTLLKSSKKYLTDETLLIVSVALCMMMVVLAHQAGFSPALGAFIMGSILAETNKVEKIEHLISPLKNIFGAVFFVSVGMLIDFEMVLEFYFPILLGTFILLFAKPFFILFGSLISGQTLKTSIQSGMSLSQIGEFSFIIASLGLSLGVVSEHLYPVAVAISVLTTFTTPFMIKLSLPVNALLERKLPQKWKNALLKYSNSTQKVAEINEWKNYVRTSIINVVVFSVLIISIIFISNAVLGDFVMGNNWGKTISTLITFTAIAPFLWALAFKGIVLKFNNKKWKMIQRGPIIAILIIRIGLVIFFIGTLFATFFSTWIALTGMLFAVVILIIFRNKIQSYYLKIEKQFMLNFNARELDNKISLQTPWDSHIITLEINPNSMLVGQTLQESHLRETFGINIASLKRGENVINVPDRFEKIFPYDKISIIGTEAQINHFKLFIESEIKNFHFPETIHDVVLKHFSIIENSELIGQRIKESGIRNKTKSLVVGIEREGEKILNPESDFVFELNDTVWLVGDEKRITVFIEKQ
jgi:CPA2 family monovalent cation:H+ antiporter-2